jgi:uncharacterized protein YoxC
MMSETTEVLLAIYLAMYIIVGLAALIAILYLVLKVKGFLRQVSERVNPLLKQVEDTVSKVTSTAQQVAEQAEQITHTARSTADHVARRVESTTDLLRDTITEPVVSVNSVLAGVRKAADVLRERWTRRAKD